MESIIFSIVMPVFNSSSTLKRSVESVQNQTYNNWELVIVDDGSKDASLNMMTEFAERDDRIKVYHQDNVGPGMARNNGIRKCTGDYIAFLDSDDYWDEQYLELVYEVVDKEYADVVFTDRVYERQDGTVIRNSNIYSNKDCSKRDILRKQMTGIIPWGMGKIYKKNILDKMSVGFTQMDVGEEALFSFDAVNESKIIGFVEKPVYHYVQSPQGQHKKGELDPWEDVVSSMKNHLINIGQYEYFSDDINSFALRALCISVNRCALLPKYSKYKNAVKKKITQYERQYNLKKFNKTSIDNTSIAIYYLLKIKMYAVIFIAAKIRKKKLSY